MTDRYDVSERVRAALLKTGLTCAQFAADIGVSPTELSLSLNDERRFTSLDLARIAEVCGVTTSWLLDVEELPPWP